MKLLKKNAENLGKITQILKEGGILAHPADTCYGLAGDLMNRDALKKLQQIKRREAQKPMSLMLPTEMKSEVENYARLDDFAKKVVEKLLPGPVTLVLPKGPKIPSWFFPEVETIGIRIPDDELTQEILEVFGGPLITTSANASGQPACAKTEEVLEVFKEAEHQPEVILEGQIPGDCLPSTVILVKDGRVDVLREGPLGKREIERTFS